MSESNEQLQNSGFVREYSPEGFPQLAEVIEPHLKALSSAERDIMSIEDRRKKIGIISNNELDIILVDIGEVPIESPSSSNPDLTQKTIEEVNRNKPTSVYKYNNGLFLVRSSDGRNWIVANVDMMENADKVFESLYSTGFREESLYVPFSSYSGGIESYGAALNGPVPGLASDIIPAKYLPDAENYKFYTEESGETVAGILPAPQLGTGRIVKLLSHE